MKMIKKSRIITCSQDEAWWKWTTHEGLLTFFGTDNKIELKPGGAFEVYFLMDNPKGLRGSEGCKILSYLPKEMISFSWNAPPQFPEIRDHEHKTWVVVNFRSVQEKRCEVIIKHLGWLQGKLWGDVYEYFDSAWETVLEWMEKSCTNSV